MWDGDTGQALFELAEKNMGVTRLALSPDGDRLAVAGIRAETVEKGAKPSVMWFVRVYELSANSTERQSLAAEMGWFTGGRELCQLTDKKEWMLGLAFSPDGERLAASGSLGTILIWDQKTRESIVGRHGMELGMDVTFSPDGRRLAVAGRPMCKVLDATTGEDLLVLRTDNQRVWNTVGGNPRIRFSHDGKRLAALFSLSLSVWSAVEDSPETRAARRQAADQRAAVHRLREAAAVAPTTTRNGK